MKTIELRPLKDSNKNYEAIEKRIAKLFKREIYLPLVKLLDFKTAVLKNAKSTSLLEAIQRGQIQFYRGSFSGRLNADISKDLKALGALWDSLTRTFKLPRSSLTLEIRNAISASESAFRTKISAIDSKLAQIVPGEIADHLKISKLFDQTLWQTDKDLNGSLRRVVVAPTLSPESRKRIADEWQTNMRLWIKDWTQKEIEKLREGMQASVFAGNRHDTAIRLIQKSHDVSLSKAKFLASQETRLLLTKFKQTRYEDAGVNEYRWGISNHPIAPAGAHIKGFVRHDHGALAGKIFRWDNPPMTDQRTGARNNPGQDYNCRCFAIPLVKFKGEKTK